MQPYSQETMDQVLKLIPHENHRKLATMLMENVSIDEIKTHGFDDLQIEQYQSLIENVLGKDVQEATQPEEAQEENKVEDNDNSTDEEEKTDETTKEDEIVDTEKGEVIPA